MFLLDASAELILKSPTYKKALDLYIWQAYLNDLSRGDVTTDFFVDNKGQQVVAEVMAKEDGVLAGMQEVEWFLKKAGISIVRHKKDGVKVGHVIYAVYVKNPKNGKMEWWYMDRNYGKGYPKMPMSKAAYLKKFKGKVKVVGSYTTTQNIAPGKFAPFKLPK